MKKLFALLLFCTACIALSAHAQAVNNRTFTIDPLPPPVIGMAVPTEWRLYCSTTPDTSTWNKATALIKTVLLPALTTGVIPLADTITYCAATFAGSAALEGLYSNVVYAKPYGTPVIKITMDLNILLENFVENSLPTPITAIKVNGVTVRQWSVSGNSAWSWSDASWTRISKALKCASPADSRRPDRTPCVNAECRT